MNEKTPIDFAGTGQVLRTDEKVGSILCCCLSAVWVCPFTLFAFYATREKFDPLFVKTIENLKNLIEIISIINPE